MYFSTFHHWETYSFIRASLTSPLLQLIVPEEQTQRNLKSTRSKVQTILTCITDSFCPPTAGVTSEAYNPQSASESCWHPALHRTLTYWDGWSLVKDSGIFVSNTQTIDSAPSPSDCFHFCFDKQANTGGRKGGRVWDGAGGRREEPELLLLLHGPSQMLHHRGITGVTPLSTVDVTLRVHLLHQFNVQCSEIGIFCSTSERQ